MGTKKSKIVKKKSNYIMHKYGGLDFLESRLNKHNVEMLKVKVSIMWILKDVTPTSD